MALDISPFVADAQRLQKETGIPASITLGQMILESSGKNPGGMSGLAYYSKNLFGIKGTGPAGTSNVWSQEYDAGGGRVSGFRKYNTYYESMVDHGKLLQTDRYASKLKGAKTAEDFAKGIQAGGYATDPNYSQQLMNIINSNGLTKYDDGTPYAGGGGGSSTGGDKGGIFTSVAFGVIRGLLIIVFFLVSILFFAKAFPKAEATVSDGVKTVNKYRKAKKGGGASGGATTE